VQLLLCGLAGVRTALLAAARDESQPAWELLGWVFIFCTIAGMGTGHCFCAG